MLGTVDDGWSIVQEVLAFERVGIARYARCERLLQWAPAALGDAVGRPARPSSGPRGPGCSCTAGGPACSPTGWWPPRRRARSRPGDAAAYRIAVTRLDQESAEVLMDIVGSRLDSTDDEQRRFARAVEDHHRYSVAATVSSGSIEMQRILLARTLLAAS